MVRVRTAYKAYIALLCVIFASPASATGTGSLSPLVLNGRFKVAWSGITIGRINIIAYEDATSYRMSIDTKTRGIGSLISDESQIVTAHGTKAAAFSYIPRKYDSRPQKHIEEEDVITLTYDEKGDIANRLRTKDDDPAWRAPVAFATINTARDPITATFMLRRMLYASLPNGPNEVATRTYDGKRLAEMRLIRAANAKVEVMGEYKDTVNVAITRTPIEGYTPKELKKFKKGDPEIRIYFTNDAAFLPVRATAKTPVGELSMTLVGTDAN